MSTLRMNHDAKVLEIIHSYRSTRALHPVISDMFESPKFKRMFWASMTHDLHVILQRSQNLADGEITPMQKAFRVLMDRIEDESAAIELYVEEILGLKFVSEMEKAQTLATAMQTRDFILKAESRSSQVPLSTPAFQEYPDNFPSSSGQENDCGGFFASNDNQDSRFASTVARQANCPTVLDKSGDSTLKPNTTESHNEKLEKLLTMFSAAKSDFCATFPRSLERTKSAKFLRDTTENCLALIAARQTASDNKVITYSFDLLGGSTSVDELKATLDEAIAAAEEGSGGKKRRFDENWADIPDAPANMRAPSVINSLGNRDPAPRGRSSGQKIVRYSTSRQPLPTPSPPKPRYSPRRRIAKAERIPRDLVPASAGQGTRRVLPMLNTKCYDKRAPFPPPGYGDCYRPSYQ